MQSRAIRHEDGMVPVDSTDRATAGLIIREREPVNMESAFDRLDSLLTPNELFYIRSHFKAPKIRREDYKLEVGGAVQRPFAIGYDELRALPAITRTATLECAGNGRIFLAPQAKGAPWGLGAVSTAEWTGVPLTTLLDRAGINVDAAEIVFQGADKGTPKEDPIPPGETPYARSLSVADAKDALLAYAMNGEELSADHGFPLRAIVPGHYGMASVKWLTRIRVVAEPFRGYFQTSDYAYWDDQEGNPVRVPLGRVALKSAIARPRTREVVAAGSNYRVFGAAWGSFNGVATVEVSTDDGDSWRPARFLDEPSPFIWSRWEFAWKVPTNTGPRVLKSRATDSDGNAQPAEHDRRFGSYVIHHTLPIEIVVR